MSDPSVSPRPSRSRAHVAAPLLWAAAGAAAALATAGLEPNLLEEGIVVHSAERMAEGEHLYRDIVFFTGPLPFELLAALFRIFGAKLLLARGAVVVLHALSTGLVFATARRAGAGVFSHPAAAALAAAPVLLFPLYSTFYYTTVAFHLGIAAVYAGVRGAGDARWAFAAGALVAGVALCKQNTGAVLAAGFVPAFLLAAPAGRRVAAALPLVLGGVAVAAATTALYALRGDLGALVWNLVELPLSMGETYRMPFPNLWPPGTFEKVVRENWLMYVPSLYYVKYGLLGDRLSFLTIAGTQLLFALPFAALAATPLVALRRRLPGAAWGNAALLLAFTTGLFPRSDWGHLVPTLPPAAVQLALLGAAFRGGRGGPVGLGVALGTVAAFAAATTLLAFWLHSMAGPPTFGPRVPLRPVSPSTTSPAIPRVIRYLLGHARRDEYIFIPRQEPLLYFATRTRNPTPFEGVFPGLADLQEPVILEALAGLRYVVMSDIDQPLYTYYGDEMPRVQAYLERHFRLPRDFRVDDASWVVVLERGPDRGEVLLDLVHAREEARTFVRDREGGTEPVSDRPPRLGARHLHRPLPVVLGSGGGGLDFDLTVPEDAVFRAGVGYRRLVSVEGPHEHPPGLTLEVAIRLEDGAGGFETLESVRISDHPRGGRHWRPVGVDLSEYAHRRVTLRLDVHARWPLRPGQLTWWGSPRITRKPDGS